MLYYIARSNILKSHRFFTEPPKKHVRQNIQSKTLDIFFLPVRGDDFELYNFEKMFPLLTVKEGECNTVEIIAIENGYTITAIEKDIKLDTFF